MQIFEYLRRRYFDLRYCDDPVGPLRDEFLQTIGNDDFTLECGFIAEVVDEGAGAVDYVTQKGNIDQQRVGLSAGDCIGGVCGIPTILRTIRGTSTVTRIRIGIIA